MVDVVIAFTTKTNKETRAEFRAYTITLNGKTMRARLIRGTDEALFDRNARGGAKAFKCELNAMRISKKGDTEICYIDGSKLSQGNPAIIEAYQEARVRMAFDLENTPIENTQKGKHD